MNRWSAFNNSSDVPGNTHPRAGWMTIDVVCGDAPSPPRLQIASETPATAAQFATTCARILAWYPAYGHLSQQRLRRGRSPRRQPIAACNDRVARVDRRGHHRLAWTAALILMA